MTTTKQPCKAKDPRTCPWHGAELRMEEAKKNGDFEAYYEARQELEKLDTTKTWTEDQAVSIIPLTKEELKQVNSEIKQATGGVRSLYNNLYMSHGKPITYPQLKDSMILIDQEPPTEGANEVWYIFSYQGRLFRYSGWYDSWDGTEWNEDQNIEEVEPDAHIVTKVRRYYKTRLDS